MTAMLVWSALFLALVLGVALLRPHGGSGALRILDERFQRGEIDSEAYLAGRALLGG